MIVFFLFLGLSIWFEISSLSNLLLKIQSHLKLIHTVAPEFNRKHLFVRRYELDYFLNNLRSLAQDLLATKEKLNRLLMELYSEDVISEWFDLYVTPTENQINTTLTEFKSVRNIITWPRRPFN